MRLFLVVVALAGLAQPALAQDAAKGASLARGTCVACHAVERGAIRSPIADAPAFQTLAQNPGITSIALTVALSSAHRTMPNIQLSPDETRDVAGYILSLREP